MNKSTMYVMMAWFSIFIEAYYIRISTFKVVIFGVLAICLFTLGAITGK